MRKLKKVYVEVTNICNLNCSFCPKTKREKAEMSEEFFEEVLKKIKPHTDYIYMHVMGEPLNHSKISSLFDICEKYQIKANITTNGTLLNTAGKEIVKKSALRQMNISVHSFEKDDEIQFEKYLRNIIAFIRETKKERDIIFCIRLWNLGSRGEEKINSLAARILEDEFGLEEEILRGVTDRNGIRLDHKVFLQQEERFIWPDAEGDEIFTKGNCFGLKTHVGILADGTVIPCCIDSEGVMNLGNIKDNTLLEILEGERALAISKGFGENKVVEKLCRTCGFRHNA